VKGEAAALSVRAQRWESHYFSTTPCNCNGILQLLLLVFQTQSIIHECSCHQRNWHCPLRFTEVLSKLTATLSLNLNIQIMFKEYQFSANTAQTLPNSKCIMKVMNLHATCSSMVTPYSSYVQFLTIPWEEVVWKWGKVLSFSVYILWEVQTIHQFSEQVHLWKPDWKWIRNSLQI
jgi:hypothetical protein